ncbi:MAG TPA: SAM-dependent methyltransferase, partial [Thermoanaerobaculia bacterium]|nr:SAM-dependent methyltransferase [Thermoanaerobaculia bacterium]
GPRAKKDPRDLKLLDPACGSGHFLLYSFDLLLSIYEEAWADPSAAPCTSTGRTLRQDYADIEALRKAVPLLILEQNLHGVDIDPRCAQIAALALWLRAQRAWKEVGLPASQRPRITKTNIVVAEPMPGDAALVEEFAATLNPPLLGTLFRKMVAEMRLAGELGTLLKVETLLADEIRKANVEYNRQKKTTGYLPGFEPPATQEELDFSQIDDETFFDRAEELLLAALRRFAESAAGAKGERRRLFAGDAAQGIALIDTVRAKYDVVLMNPPFGLTGGDVYEYLKADYEDCFIDLLASFVSRAEDLSPAGLIGALTSRACLYTKTLLDWRARRLSGRISLLADLGIGVLEGAMVRACAYVIPAGGQGVTGTFLNLRGVTEKEAGLLELVKGIAKGSGEGGVFVRGSDFFSLIPQRRVLYSLPHDFWKREAGMPRVEPEAATIRAGLTTYDDPRFLRLRWEVPPSRAAADKWVLLSKGGYFGTFFNDVHLLVRWDRDGREVGAHNCALYDTDAQSRRGSSFYRRPALTYSRRTDFFSAKALPSNCFFSDKGPAILPLQGESPLSLLG